MLETTDVALKRGDSSSSRASSKLSKKDIGPPTAFRHQFHIGPDVVSSANTDFITFIIVAKPVASNLWGSVRLSIGGQEGCSKLYP